MKYRQDDIVNINTIKLFRETVTRNNWSVSSGGPIKIKELRTTNFDENKKLLIDWLEKQKLLIQ
jgi:hypothetical protein